VPVISLFKFSIETCGDEEMVFLKRSRGISCWVLLMERVEELLNSKLREEGKRRFNVVLRLSLRKEGTIRE
jgi:hypothetical protein